MVRIEVPKLYHLKLKGVAAEHEVKLPEAYVAIVINAMEKGGYEEIIRRYAKGGYDAIRQSRVPLD
jgi:hypothetical protein